MCWNKEISLNTFIASIGVLALIYYNNKYTQYKIGSFDKSIFRYLFFISFISIQLVEYFLWKYLNNPKMNRLISIICMMIIFLQPIFLILGFTEGVQKKVMFIGYLVFIFIYFSYRFFINPVKISSSKAANGHLSWDWIKMRGWEILFIIIWLGFFIVALTGRDNLYGGLLASVLLLWSIYLYYKTNTWGSLWCWIANIAMIFLLFNLLIILPFKEHGFCGIV